MQIISFEAAGNTLIDVGGKEEMVIYLLLIKKLNLIGHYVLDLDA